MPGRDGTGPEGLGPFTGRGMGFRRGGRGQGFGRGYGRRMSYGLKYHDDLDLDDDMRKYPDVSELFDEIKKLKMQINSLEKQITESGKDK